MTTLTGYVMTLANSIIGVSLLAMPYCFKQCGLLLAILLLLTSNVVTRLACHFLVKSAVMCRRTSFELLAYHAFGRSGKLFVELGVIGFLLGTCVAFFVVIGDLAPAILARLFQLDNNYSLRTVVLVVSSLVVVLPLSMLRHIESLAAISTLTMLFYTLLTIKLLAESFPHLAAADWTSSVNYWRPEGVLQCFPIFAMALSCQTQMFEILEVLPGASLERMNGVVRSAVGLCTGFYIAVGFLGYVAYAREPIGGNILLSFGSSVSSDVFQLGFVASIALSFPLVVFPCRASLHSLLSKRVPQYHDPATQATYIADVRFKFLTLGIVGSSLVIGLMIPNIEFVLGFVGSTIGVATCIIFPAGVFINISNKDTSERLVAKVILFLGVVVMILGTFVNIETIAERKVVLPSEPVVKMADGIGGVMELPPRVDALPPVLQPPLGNLPQDFKENVIPVKPKSEPTASPVKPDEKRKEPPIPVPPVPGSKIEEPMLKKVLDLEADKKSQAKTQESKLPPTAVAQIEAKNPNVPPSDGIIAAVENKTVNNVSVDDMLKKGEAIHQDAIAKEEKELKENDKIKDDELRKQEELLKKLKEHQEEQKNLLKEQQNILDEIKIRDEINDRQKEQKTLLEEQKNILKEIKIHGAEIKVDKVNIDKMQGVIDDLKERKQANDKTMGEKIAENKKKMAEKNVNKKEEKIVKAEFNTSGLARNNTAIPLPLLKQVKILSQPDAPLGNILEEKQMSLDRVKREIDGSCKKNGEDIPITEISENKLSDDNPSIQGSKVLSPPETSNIDLVSPVKTDNLQPLIGAKEEGKR